MGKSLTFKKTHCRVVQQKEKSVDDKHGCAFFMANVDGAD